MKETREASPATTSILEGLLPSYKRSLMAQDLSKSTLRTYTDTAKAFCAFLQSHNMPTDPSAIAREHVEEFLTYLYTKPVARKGGTPPAGASKMLWYAGLASLFKWLVGVDEIKESPMLRMKRPKGSRSIRPVLTDEQVKRVLKVCETDSTFAGRRDHALIRLFIDTGLRLSEMVAIHLDDIDWEEQSITVRYGKGGKSRIVYFGRKSAKALDQYVHLRGGRREHPDAALKELWLSARGALTQSGVQHILKRRGEQAGLHLHAHLWRHFFVHSSLVAGMTEGDIMRITGHTRSDVLRIYGESAADSRAKEAHRKMSPSDRL